MGSRRRVEVAEFARFASRILAAWGRRVGEEGGPDDLAALERAGREVERAVMAAVATMRADGATWSELAAGMGVTRQALAQRVGRHQRAAGAAVVEGEDDRARVEREDAARRVVGPGRRGGLRLS